MQIQQNTVVSLSYTLKLQNGEIADQTDSENPFVFIHGIGQTLEAFDNNLTGLETGSKFNFSLSAEEGYGKFNPEAVVKLDKSIFSGPHVSENLLTEGNMVPMQDQNGNPMDGIIREIEETTVTVDFNHPLADEILHFSGEIINVRQATAEELDHGHVHGPGGHHH